MIITTTLNAIREHSPCADGWTKLLGHLGKTKADDEPLPLLTVLDSNGLDDTLWCLRTRPDLDRLWRLYAVWCARQVQHLMTDQSSIDALDVAERYARGEATDVELDAARAAAWDVAWDVASATAWDVASATAWDVARDAAWAAARDAAWDVAWAAANVAASYAAWDAARAAALAAARDAQAAKLREVLTTGEW